MKTLRNTNKFNVKSNGVQRSAFSSKGFQTKIIRGSKAQKGKRIQHKLYHKFGRISLRQNERVGRFVLVAMESARLSAHELEAARRALKKLISKRFYLLMRVYPFVAITKRPSDVRMGKGKGTRIIDWIYPVRPGKILCEITLRKWRRNNLAKNMRYAKLINGIFKKVEGKFSIAVKALMLI